MSRTIQAPIPILRSFDEEATRAFYLDFLEFEVEFEHRFEPSAPLYLSVVRGDCVIHLSEHHGDATPGSALRIEIDDVTSFAAELVAKRYKHAAPGVQRVPWGFDEMSVIDPSGNRLVFCTGIELP